MPPRAACTVSSASPASATSSHSRGRERSAPASSGDAASTNATSSQLLGLSGAHRPMAWRAASFCSTPSTYSGVFQSAGLAHSATSDASATAMLSPGRVRAALEHEVGAGDGGAREHCAVQVPPQREQRDEQPDAARGRTRLAAQEQHAGGEQRQREELGADRDDRAEAGRHEQQQHHRERPLARAGAARVAREQRERPRDRSDLRDLQAPAPGRREQGEDSSPSTGTFGQPALTAEAYGTPSGMLPRSAIARPSSDSHGPSAAWTLRSAANAVTASAASPPGRASGRSGSPRRGRALMALNVVHPSRRPRACERPGCAIAARDLRDGGPVAGILSCLPT